MAKIDISKLKRISTFAKENGVSIQTIHNWNAVGRVEILEIDGFKFVYAKK